MFCSVYKFIWYFSCVSKNGPHILLLYTRVSFVSGSTLHMKIYFDPYKNKRDFFPP